MAINIDLDDYEISAGSNDLLEYLLSDNYEELKLIIK